MNKLLQTRKKEKPLVKFEEVCKYIKSKNIDLEKFNIILNLENYLTIEIRDSQNTLIGLCIYRPNDDRDGHFIYFFGADTKEALKLLLYKGLQERVWPKEAYRYGKYKEYKHPEKLISKLFNVK